MTRAPNGCLPQPVGQVEDPCQAALALRGFLREAVLVPCWAWNHHRVSFSSGEEFCASPRQGSGASSLTRHAHTGTSCRARPEISSSAFPAAPSEAWGGSHKRTFLIPTSHQSRLRSTVLRSHTCEGSVARGKFRDRANLILRVTLCTLACHPECREIPSYHQWGTCRRGRHQGLGRLMGQWWRYSLF